MYLVSGFAGYNTLNVSSCWLCCCVEDYWGLRERRPNPGRAIAGGT